MENVTPDVGGALHTSLELVLGYGSDLFVFVGVVALVGLFALYFGRDRLTPLVAGCYAALALYTHFPFESMLGGNVYLEVALYLAIALVGLVAFSGLAGFMSSGGIGFFKVFALAIIVSLFMMAVAVNLFPTLHAWSVPTKALFAPNLYFWWLLAPLAGVFLLGK